MLTSTLDAVTIYALHHFTIELYAAPSFPCLHTRAIFRVDKTELGLSTQLLSPTYCLPPSSPGFPSFPFTFVFFSRSLSAYLASYIVALVPSRISNVHNLEPYSKSHPV